MSTETPKTTQTTTTLPASNADNVVVASPKNEIVVSIWYGSEMNRFWTCFKGLPGATQNHVTQYICQVFKVETKAEFVFDCVDMVLEFPCLVFLNPIVPYNSKPLWKRCMVENLYKFNPGVISLEKLKIAISYESKYEGNF